MTHPNQVLRATVVIGGLAVLALAGLAMSRHGLSVRPFVDMALAIITVQPLFWLWNRAR